MSGKAVRETLGFVGVVASLVFVGTEIRQNTTAIRGTTVQAIADMSFQATLAVSEDDELADAFRLASEGKLDSLSVHEKTLMQSFTTASLRIVESRYRQVRLGILDEDQIFVVGGSSGFYGTEWFRSFWEEPMGRGAASPDFAAWVDSTFIQ